MDGGWNTKKLIFFLFSCSFLLLIHHVPAQDPWIQDCSNSANYTTNSKFKTNLNLLLQSLLSNGTRDGFFNDTMGSSPDTVYGLAQCRGDIPPQDCRTCLNTSSVEIVKICPNRKSAALRYEYCILRYSNRRFSGEYDGNFKILYNSENVSDADADRFDQQLGVLMNNLSTIAASRESRDYWGSINYIPISSIHGLVQCTTDLSPTNCMNCVQNALSSLQGCCRRSRGAQVYSTTCFVRYDMYSFVQRQSPQVDAPPPPSFTNKTEEEGGNGKGNSTKVVAIVAPIIGGSVFLLAICACMIFRRTSKIRSKRKTKLNYDQDDMRSEDSLQFNLNIIRTATNDFSDDNKLGEGGFGAVYKGVLVDGQEVAVKRLSENSGQGSQEFKNEVVLLHKLQHRNLVRLLGFCLSGEEKLLIYEYVPNRSLDKYIFDPIRKASLDWERRYKIIQGIARGLLYLHQDSQLRIIHRDLKAGNILLDSKMNPKIADFGMAKLFGVDQTQGNTSKIVGTFGYMSPEYVFHGLFSVKSDVYSFGVLLLEIITGQKASDFHLSGHSGDLISYVWKKWRDENALEVMDPTLLESFSSNELMRCIHIGLLCVQENAEDRPTMSTIILMLNSYSVTLQIPSSPAFMSQTMTATNASKNGLEYKDSTTSSLLYSGDDSISYDFPR